MSMLLHSQRFRQVMLFLFFGLELKWDQDPLRGRVNVKGWGDCWNCQSAADVGATSVRLAFTALGGMEMQADSGDSKMERFESERRRGFADRSSKTTDKH